MDDTVPQDTPEASNVVDGEIVEQRASADSSDQATILLSLEQLIKTYISTIDKLKVEKKKHKEMLEDAFLNDTVYQEHLEAVKAATKIKNTTRQQIAQHPANVVLSNKIKEMTAELRDKQQALSDYLLEYQRLTGANEIEDEEGQLHDIVNNAKVIKKKG